MSKNIKESIEYLDKAIKTLEKVVIKPIDSERMVMDTSIKRFEYSFELFWKTLGKKLSEDHGIEVHSPKEILQHAYTNHLISNEPMWLSMLKDRNLGTHTYKQSLADEIFERIKTYAPFLRTEFNKCFK